jgi:hypothetical protein
MISVVSPEIAARQITDRLFVEHPVTPHVNMPLDILHEKQWTIAFSQ